MSTREEIRRPRKLCFVTIGATAGFDSLLKATLSPPFLEALQANGYTDLLLQHGQHGHTTLKAFQDSRSSTSETYNGLQISGFDFNKQGLGHEMRAAKGGGDSVEGVVVSHAGTSLLFGL